VAWRDHALALSPLLTSGCTARRVFTADTFRAAFERPAERRAEERPTGLDGERGERRLDAEFDGLCPVDAAYERGQEVVNGRVPEVCAPPSVEVTLVGPRAREGRAAEGAGGFAKAQREFSEPPAAHDKAGARIFAHFGQFDPELAAELDDRPRGQERVGRPLGDAVLRPDRLNEAAGPAALFEQRDLVALLVEGVGGEHPRYPRAYYSRLASRLV
jgi:hypothetical protein